jgi:predicted transcriptional regulator
MTHIDSIEKLEVLLLLRNRTEREWTASEVALELRITEASAAARLADLASSGLLVNSAREAPAGYRYSPAHSDDVRSISELAMTYSERRVSVITFIFTKPQERVRGFADAFLLRQRKDGNN